MEQDRAGLVAYLLIAAQSVAISIAIGIQKIIGESDERCQFGAELADQNG